MGYIARALRLTLVTGLGVLLAHSTFSTGAAQTGKAEEQPDLVIVQAPVLQSNTLSQRFPQGSRLVRLAGKSHSPLNLTPDFFAAADPRISFDGLRVLFAAEKSADGHWQIWEMNADGSNPRQVSHCTDDCVKPAYLPRGEIVFTALSARATGETSQLWVSKVDGSDPHPITFGPGDFQVETVLKNGVILATARSPLLPTDGQPADRQLYTLRPDGSDLATLRCDHQHAAVRSQAEELDDGSVVFVKTPLSPASLSGELAWIRRGALHNAPLTSSQNPTLSPEPLAAEKLVVAREPGSANPSGKKLALYAFDAAQGRFGALIYEDPKLSSLAAVPVAAHEPPRWYWSTLNPELQTGYFICIDAYEAEGFPRGRMAGVLSKVRVLTLDDPATHRERSLGEAPIEGDGSFYIAVPPDKPIRFEVLDAAGRVVRAQRSWIWSRSGEEHGCVGCHEDRALAPENRWPLALRRFDTPTRLGVEAHPETAH
ncbi:MAG: hypothetical protein LAO04_13150 [Acidobacteriia bacterium]|nr:hypothetical protein [Terriglobia bacterium]